MKILIFGDVVAKPGRKAIAAVLPQWKKEHAPDLVLANVENLAHGVGASAKTLAELTNAGVDVFTSGNHIWGKDVVPILDDPNGMLLRPANYPPGNPGRGSTSLTVNGRTVVIINLLGRVFFRESVDCPFRTADALLSKLVEVGPRPIMLVDFHAEATSEKIAMGHYLDGRVTAIYGTHTHIPTADARILPKGTAYITDVGMVGLRESIIGADKDSILKMFLMQTPGAGMHDVADHGIVVASAMLLEVNDEGKPTRWELLQRTVEV
jgi:metallophosphoesterase (TIGR00282 family)